MSAHHRIASIERHLGLGTGPKQACPDCDGTGARHEIDGEWTAAMVQRRFRNVAAALLAERDATPPPPPEPEPPEARFSPKVMCWRCSGTGRVTVAAAQQHEAECQRNGEALERQMLAIAARMRGQVVEE